MPNRRAAGRVDIEQDYFARHQSTGRNVRNPPEIRVFAPKNGLFTNHGQTDDRLCKNTLSNQTQPCRHKLSSCKSRQAMTCFAFENTASISTSSMGSVSCSGSITLFTKKCFCLAMGLTAVHLLNSSFLGFSGFMNYRPQRLVCISRNTSCPNSITAMA